MISKACGFKENPNNEVLSTNDEKQKSCTANFKTSHL